jgi:hypothetical protein
MAFHVFLFLLVVCLVLLSLALLWRLDWFPFPTRCATSVIGSQSA